MTRNRIEVDDLDPNGTTEYLTEDSEITRKVTAYLQEEVDDYMAGLSEDNEINLRVTSAVVGAIQEIAINLQGAGIDLNEPKIPEEWRLFDMSEEEWKASKKADTTRGAFRHPGEE